jgi:hypothetical protein
MLAQITGGNAARVLGLEAGLSEASGPGCRLAARLRAAGCDQRIMNSIARRREHPCQRGVLSACPDIIST